MDWTSVRMKSIEAHVCCGLPVSSTFAYGLLSSLSLVSLVTVVKLVSDTFVNAGNITEG